MTGTVSRFSDIHGWGFIRGDDKNDYFIHYSDIFIEGYRTLFRGQRVVFEALESERGLAAKELRLQLSKTEMEVNEKIILKKNPFTPQDPVVDPLKFYGRKDPFINAIDAILNNKNVLISGPRGIGKSSLAYQLLYMTKGERKLIDTIGIDIGKIRFNRLTGDFRCLPTSNLADVINSLLYTLAVSAGIDCEVETKETAGVDLKFFKYQMETQVKDLSVSELATYFASTVYKINKNKCNSKSGICFLVDEIDVLSTDVQLGPFIKSVVEKFRFDGYHESSFILSGVTGTITTLVSQHLSAQRLFEMLELDKMTNKELKEIVVNLLANVDTGIDDDTANNIVSIASGFPQPVHLIGYHSYRLDDDKYIDDKDYRNAVNFIALNIKKQEFQTSIERLGRGLGWDILKSIALSEIEPIDPKVVMEKINEKDTSLFFGILGNLNKDGYIEINSKSGISFRDKLFKIYVRLVNNYSS